MDLGTIGVEVTRGHVVFVICSADGREEQRFMLNPELAMNLDEKIRSACKRIERARTISTGN